MPAKNLFGITRDSRGNYRRQNLGKVWRNGEWQPQTFYLGKNHAQAALRAAKLEKLWESISLDWSKYHRTPIPCWDDTTLAIAQAVARGEEEVTLSVPPEIQDTADGYQDSETFIGLWLRSLQELFPQVRLRVAGEIAAAVGAERVLDEVAEELTAEADGLRSKARLIRGQGLAGEMLHTALRAFLAHVHKRHGTQDYGRSFGNQVKFLIEHSKDIPLLMLTGDKLTEWQTEYERRPIGARGQLAYRSCVNLIKTIREFATWLDTSTDFTWDLPRKYRFPRMRVQHTAEELAAKLRTGGHRVFTVDELTTLWQYALPGERALIVLALNCGFGRKELATLMEDEIFLDHEHPRYKVRANFIKRLRRKTSVYGEWLLWPETVKAIEWLRKHRPQGGRTGHLILNKNGKPLDESTKGGNANGQIPNTWGRLIRRVKKDFPTFPQLPFGRVGPKTGASMIRSIAGGEISSMYISHGPTSDTQDKLLAVYANRPWGRLHKALRKLRRKLEPVLASEPDPFPQDVKEVRPEISLGKIRRIKELVAQGFKPSKVAEMVGVSQTTVRRYAKTVPGQQPPATPAQ